jgi:Tol biopolymer transport system component
VRLTDLDGTETVDLATDAVASDGIAWAPRGDQIAYLTAIPPTPYGDGWFVRSVSDEGDRELGRAHRTTHYEGTPPSVALLSWSPDGDHVAVIGPGGSWSFQCSMDALQLWVLALDDDDDAEAEPVASDVDEAAPVWSADGRGFMYGHHDLICGDDFSLADFGWNVRAHSIDRDDPVDDVDRVHQHDVWGPVWSPLDDLVAYNSGSRSDPIGEWEIVIEDPAAGIVSRIASAGCRLEATAWFPDGARLLARRACGAEFGHVVLDVTGGAVVHELPDLGRTVALSPDGEQIAFVRATDDGPQVMRFELAGDRSIGVGGGTAPAWRPR